MNPRLLALAAFFLSSPMLKGVDVEMKIDVAGAERTVVIRLDRETAPKTCDNFVKLCREGFYDGVAFHRVIPNYIVQGGDPLTRDPAERGKWGTGGPGYTLPAELGGQHVRGAIAASRLGDAVNPERVSSGSQFYVVLRDIKPLDGQYTVFGKILSGLEAFDEIAGAPADEKQVPTADISIIGTKVLPEPGPAGGAVPAVTPDLSKADPAAVQPVTLMDQPAGAPAASALSAVAAVEGPQPGAAKEAGKKEAEPRSDAATAAASGGPKGGAAKQEAAVMPAVGSKAGPAGAPEPGSPKPAAPTEPSAVAAKGAPAEATPGRSALSLNDSAVSAPQTKTAPAPGEAAPAVPTVADALAAAMRAKPAPELGGFSTAPAASPGQVSPAPAAPAVLSDPKREPSLSDLAEDRMTVNTDRGLAPVRLAADGDSLARATAELGGKAPDPSEGFLPLSSVGNFGQAAPAPAPVAVPREERAPRAPQMPEPPRRSEVEADPLAMPTFRQGPLDRAESQPEPAEPIAPAVIPAAGPAAGTPDPEAAPGAVPAPPQAAPEKPRGFFGKFIRRIW